MGFRRVAMNGRAVMNWVPKGGETEGRREGRRSGGEGAAKDQLASMDGRTKRGVGIVVLSELATVLLMNATAGLEGQFVSM